MQIDIEGLKHNRIMARARGNYELYLLVRQMVRELNQGIKRFSEVAQPVAGDYIVGRLNKQNNERITCESRVFKQNYIVHHIRIKYIK